MEMRGFLFAQRFLPASEPPARKRISRFAGGMMAFRGPLQIFACASTKTHVLSILAGGTTA